ncbi:MAG: ATP synthase F0 subunit B [Terracidiphilus sp.]
MIFHSRFSRRALWFVLLALLAAGVAIAPAHLRAQESAPAAASAPAASSQTHPMAAITKAGDKETEAEEDNVYRHAPIVQSLSKRFHMSVETTARFFEIINFVILVLAIGIPLVKIFPKILRKRSLTLSHSIESARKMTEDADARLSAVEARLSKLDDEIAEIRAHVEEESKNDEIRIKATIEEESSRIIAAAEQEISLAASQARRGLRHFAADLAIEQATKQLELTPDTDRALIAEFVRETAANGAGQGGQN